MTPLVSVIIPVHNGERYLSEAIASILAQKDVPLEIIVVDDGSTDATASVVGAATVQVGASVRYVYEDRRGPASARNHGIRLARGEVIGFLDHDDLWAPNSLPRLFEYLALHPETNIVQGLVVQMQRVPVPGNPNQFRFEESSEPFQFISVSSAIYQKSVFDRVGGFDETLWEGEDTDWFLRAWEKNIPKTVLPYIMLYARRHDTNMTQESGPRLLPRLFKMHLYRLRAAHGDAQSLAPDTRRPSIADYLGAPPRRRAAPPA